MSNQVQGNQNIQGELNLISLNNRERKSHTEMTSLTLLHKGIQELAQFIEEHHSINSNGTLNYAFEKDLQDRLSKTNSNILSLLRSMQADCTTMTAQEPTTTTTAETAPSTTNTPTGMDAVFDMEAMIIRLQELLVQSNSEQAQQQVEMGSATLAALQEEYKQLMKQIAKEHEHHSFWWHLKHVVKIVVESVAVCSPAAWALDPKGMKKLVQDIKNDPDLGTFLKGLSYVAIAATAMIAIGTGNFELLAVTAILVTLSETGAMDDMTQDLAKALVACGMFKSEEAAKIFADVLIVVVLALISGGAAGFGTVAEDAASTAEEEIEMTCLDSVDSAEDSLSVEESLTNETESVVENTSQKTSYEFNKTRFFGTTLSTAGQALPSTSFVVDFVQAMPMKEKDKEKLMIALEVVIIIASIAATLGGATISASAEGESALSSGIKSLLGKAENAASETLPESVLNRIPSSETIAYWGRQTLNVSSMLEGVFSILQGWQTIDKGEVLEKIAEIKGNISLLSSILNQNQKLIQSTQDHLSTELKSYNDMIQQFSNFATPELAVSETLMQG